MMTMPKQKPHRSEQSVGTPRIFIEATLNLLDVDDFSIDLAADQSNKVTERLYTEADNALTQDWAQWHGWCWLNPPYSHMEPWVQKAWDESRRGAKIAMLVPASVGSKWWRHYVDRKAHVLFLTSRLTFIGHSNVYPKDLALLLYTKYVRGGHWNWDWPENARAWRAEHETD